MMQPQTPPQLPPQSLPVVVERQVSQEVLRPTLDEGYYETERMVDQLHEQIRQKSQLQKKENQEKIELFFQKECEKLTSQLIELHQKKIDEYKQETDKRISELEMQLLLYTGKHDILNSTLKTDLSIFYSQFNSLTTNLIEVQTSITLSNIDREKSQALAETKFQSITTDLENIQKTLEVLTELNDQLQHQLGTINDTKKEIKDLFFNYPTLTLQTNCNTQDILGLQTQNLALARHIKNLSQNSVPSDSGATFMKYVAMAGILALFVGVVATSTKIMAIINHVLNQQVGL